MGIYVKYMEMPEGCVTCYLKHDCCDFKQQISSGNIIKYIDKRLDACPLIEVTEPHGRLIDESQIKTVYGEAMTTRYQGYISRTEKITHTDAPTIIESEGK